MSGDIDSDYEAYDALEKELNNKPTGLLLKLLPGWVYESLFGSLPPHPDIVASRREQASEEYQHIITKDFIGVLFKNGSIQQTEELSLEDVDLETQIDDSSPLKLAYTTRNDLKNHIFLHKKEINRVEEFLPQIRSLINADYWMYLRKSEQDRIRSAQQNIERYHRVLIISKKNIEKLQDTKRILKTIRQEINKKENYRKQTDGEIPIQNKIDKVWENITNLVKGPVGDNTIDSLRSQTETLESDIATRISFDSEIGSLESKVSSLEKAASPYLHYNEYLTGTERSQIEEILERSHSAIEALERDTDVDRLTPADQERFSEAVKTVRRVEQCLESYNNEFISRKREEYYQRKFSNGVSDIKEDLQNIRYALTPAKSHGHTITQDKEAEFRGQIAELRDAISSLRAYSPKAGKLDPLWARTDDIEAYIDAKVAFDSRIDSVESQVSSLEEAATPYLNYEEYLTENSRSQITHMTDKAIVAIETVQDEIDFEELSSPDQNRLSEASATVSEIEQHLTDYNKRFVAHEIDQYGYLFSNIGPDDLDLTLEQRRAVIRNGTYNQVIAAAGTGKTLTLTSRVAYLIESQDVNPSDILVITYTNPATDEMSERLSDQFGISDVPVKTIHSFGRELIQETQDGFVESIDPHEKRNFIDEQIRDARRDDSSTFLDHYYEFLVHFDDVYHDETDFETRKAYVEARLEQTYVTLQGTKVKSRAEKLIADFLFIHQVTYRYEDRATWAESGTEKAGYTPDFYLPDYDMYIEHWGIDESGSVAPWFSQSSEEYRDKIKWARQQFTETEFTLTETYEFEHEANRLRQVLRHRLAHHGVALDKLAFEELVDTAFEYEQREGWIKSRFGSFIENAKRFEIKPEDITAQLSEENPRQYHFGHCGVYLLREYVLYLTRNGLIDFEDMIHDAVDAIQQNPTEYRDRYEHILVDEFQDIGKGELELIRQLSGEDGARLFAVGDDWQSIYSFQGAVIDYFTDFTTYFGDPVRTELTANFRSPPTPIEAGNHLIDQNSNQVDKTVRSTRDHDHTPRVHILRGYQFYDYVRRVRLYAVNLVREYLAAGAKPNDIMVLCRYDDAVPYLTEIKDGLQSQEIPYVGKSDQYRGPDGSAERGVSVYSLYQAKGREAEHVILVHAAKGPYGFPSDRREDELLDPVKPLDVGGIQEERRGFYVAITRTKETLDFLTRAEKQSQFLTEIDEYTTSVDAGQVQPLEDIGERMTVIVEVDRVLDPWTKQHQRAILADRYGGSARFVSWASTEPPTLESGEWYRLSAIKVSKFKGEKELVWTDESTLKHLPSAPRVTERHHEGGNEVDQKSTGDDTARTDNTTPPDSVDRRVHTMGIDDAQSSDSVTDHRLFQNVLSTLMQLGGTASTAEISHQIDAGQIETFDRLRTLEAEDEINQIGDGETNKWELKD